MTTTKIRLNFYSSSLYKKKKILPFPPECRCRFFWFRPI